MIAGIALASILVAIILGFICKKNIGIIAIAIALILGKIAGLSDNDIIKNFPLSLFVNLSGIFFFFSIAERNDVMSLLSRKMLARLPHNRALFPIFTFIVIMGLSIIDTGSYAIFTLTPMITMSMALCLGCDVLMTGIMTIFASALSCYSPLGAMGIAVSGIAAGSGFTNIGIPLLIGAILLYTILGMFIYILFRGYRPKADLASAAEMNMDTPPFSRNQKLILGMMAILIVGVMIIGWHPGLCAFLCGIILLVLNTANEKEVIKEMPWDLILMITGFGLLMSLVKALGGVTLLSDWFCTFVTKSIAGPVLSFTSSFMSLFTLAVAGPIPALTPIVASIHEAIGGAIGELELGLSIWLGGMAATISPLSLGGAILMSSYGKIMKTNENESRKLFYRLFGLAICTSVLAAIVSGLRLYSIF